MQSAISFHSRGEVEKAALTASYGCCRGQASACLPRRADPPHGGVNYRMVAIVARFQAALVSASRHEVSESIELG